MREIEIFNWDGRAFGLLPEEIAFGSLICRVSGPEVCATAEAQINTQLNKSKIEE